MYGKVISMGNIYHYCSLDTFAQIIKNKTIRLSDLNKTNDYMEKKWGMKLLYRTLCDELQDRIVYNTGIYEEIEDKEPL